MCNGQDQAGEGALRSNIDVSSLGCLDSSWSSYSANHLVTRRVGLGINHHEKSMVTPPLPQYPSIFRHSCTLQTRYMLPVQNPYFSSPIIHVLCWEYTWIPLIGCTQVRAAHLDAHSLAWCRTTRRLIISGPPVFRCGCMCVLLQALVRTLLLIDYYCIRFSHLYASAVLRSTFQCSSIY